MAELIDKENSILVSQASDPGDVVCFSPNYESEEVNLKIFLLFLCLLVVLLFQFVFRDYDNNRLLSWQWVMDRNTFLSVLAMSAVGLVAVYKSCFVALSRKNELRIIMVVSFLLGMSTWWAPETMVDSGRYFGHAKLVASQGLGYFLSEWGYGIDAWTDLPLASIIYGLVFSVFGESRLAVQVMNTLMFSGTVYLTYQIGRLVWTPRIGLYAALLLLAIPFLHIQVSQLLVDVPAMFFTTLAIWASIKAILSKGTGWLLVAALSIVFALLTKYSVWMALSTLVLLPLIANGVDRKITTGRLALLGLVTLVLMVFVFYVHHPVILKQLKILLDYQLPAFQRWQESYLSTFIYQVHPVVSIAALIAIYYAVKKRETRIVVPAAAILVLLLMEVYRARYLTIVFPMLALVSAYGISQINAAPIRQFLVRGACVIAMITTLVANMGFLQNYSAVNLKEAATYLNAMSTEGVVVMIAPQPDTSVNPEILLPVLDYYLDKPVYQLREGVAVARLNQRQLATSPLRFTWDVEHYPYAEVGIEEISSRAAIVLLSGGGKPLLSPELETFLSGLNKTEFSITDNVFRFQSIVTIFYSNALRSQLNV